MFCQICGARILEGRSACAQCGAPAGRVAGLTPPAPLAGEARVRACPRCGYQGPSQAYFSTVPHLGGLVLLGMLGIWPALLYLIFRVSHRVCPSCGEGWGKHGSLALPAGGGGGTALTGGAPELATQGDGGGKRFFSWVLFALAALFMTIGVAEFEAVLLGMGLFTGGGGLLLRRGADSDRARRREAILQSLQKPVLKLAAGRGGTLTVTEVAAEFGWSLPRAEKVLQSLEDGYRVMGDVTPEGVIVYNFLELMHAPEALQPPAAPEPLPPPGGPHAPRARGTGGGAPAGAEDRPRPA